MTLKPGLIPSVPDEPDLVSRERTVMYDILIEDPVGIQLDKAHPVETGARVMGRSPVARELGEVS
jgi:hypothetical protein